MVSLWPWKGDDSSPASFEKTLSTLAGKITRANSTLDGLRQRSRRFNALWLLYTSLAYLVCSIILALVVGWKNWGMLEYGAIVGGPIVIYLVRLGLTTYYNYRISKVQAAVDDLQKQRDRTIDQLKTATKYNTTQQLLEKYGGSPSPKVKSGGTPSRKSTPGEKTNTPKGGRTGFAPPPTANIPGRNISTSVQNTPQRLVLDPRYRPGQSPPLSAGVAVALPQQQSLSPRGDSAEFAPNAFSAAPQYAQADSGLRWYDRLLDVLLGEDETLPRNRIALICRECRLVNGQASPGIKRLQEVGKWKCSGCGAVNGEDSETEKIVATIKEQTEAGKQQPGEEYKEKQAALDEITEDELARATGNSDEESDVTQYSEVSEREKAGTEAEESPEPEPAKPKRGRPKGSTKKKS